MANNNPTLAEVQTAIEAENLGWTPKENDYTRLSEKEQLIRLGLFVTPEALKILKTDTLAAKAKEAQLRSTTFSAPAAIDWRNNGGNFVTSTKDQGNCGSCVSFGSCATIESAMRIRTGNPNLAVDLSEGFMQFCGGASCDGWGLASGLEYAKTTGVVDEACMPYVATNMDCASSRCSDWANRLTKISGYTPYSSMAARKEALATKGPLLAGIQVYTDFGFNGNDVYIKSSTATYRGGHCVAVIGYDDNASCWIIKNSWGPTWGVNGIGRIGYGQADLAIDTDWPMYSVDVVISQTWQNNVAVVQVYASPHSMNAWVYLDTVGWRKIDPLTGDGVTNLLALFAQAEANGKRVSALCDADRVYQAYLL